MPFRTQCDLERLVLPPGKSEVFHFDARCPGLAVRIQRTGRPTFVAWYTAPGGKRKRLTIGPVAAVALEDARTEAVTIINAARSGRDLSTERKQARVAATEVLTAGDVIKAYLREHAERHQRPRTLIETKRALERHWQPLHSLPVVEIDRRAVSTRLLELARTSGTISANRARANLSACFAWAMRAGLVDANPVIGSVRGEETSRERVLSPEDLRAIWQATADLSGYDRMIRLLMLLGSRRLEVGGMSWAELSGDRALWVLPAARMKTKREHELPLPRQARDILAELPQLPDRPFVFGRGGRTPFSGWSRSKERLDARIADQQGKPLAEWHLHDIRRSVVTHMAELAIAPPHIIEAVVGHLSGHKGGVAGVYNRAVYRAEKAAALQAYADWFEAVVEGREPGGKVVALRR